MQYIYNIFMITVMWECFYLVFLYVSRILCLVTYEMKVFYIDIYQYDIYVYIYTLWPLFLFLGSFQPCWLWNIIYVKDNVAHHCVTDIFIYEQYRFYQDPTMYKYIIICNMHAHMLWEMVKLLRELLLSRIYF